jgi:hypothetical protein
MRDEDVDNNTDFVMSNYNGPCVAGQTNWTNGRDFVVGSSASYRICAATSPSSTVSAITTRENPMLHLSNVDHLLCCPSQQL